MNRPTALVALALAALSGAASANTGYLGDITIETRPFVSSRTRAEVQAELLAFKKAGTKANPWYRHYNQLDFFMSVTTPEQVRADYIANRAEVAALTGEDSGSMYLAEQAAANRRAARMAAGSSTALPN